MPIGHSFTGEWGEYNTLLRRFNLRSILESTNRESSLLAQQEDGSPMDAAKRVNIDVINTKTKRCESKEFIIMAWELTDLAYHAILSTNDYRGKQIETENELFCLCMAEHAFRERNEHELLEKIKNTPDFFFYLWGFFGEQNKYESPGRTFSNAARELYILLDIAPRVGIKYIENTVCEEIGVSWEVLITSLLLAWAGTAIYPSIGEIITEVNWSDELKQTDFEKVLAYFTASYDEIRSSLLKRQILYSKPYVRSMGSTLSVNRYLDLFLYEHSVFWVVRNHLQSSQQFTNDFGVLFEEYYRELLSTYVDQNNYLRIPEVPNKKRADWKVEIAGYKFLIEQKCPLVRLSAKQQDSDIAAIKEFCERNVAKALKQLEETEIDFADGPYYKIVLLYEDYLYEPILEHVFSLPSCKVKNDGKYLLVTIEDMEKLLALSRNNPEKAGSIIYGVFENHRGLSELLREAGIWESDYLQREEIKKYEELPQELLRNHLK